MTKVILAILVLCGAAPLLDAQPAASPTEPFMCTDWILAAAASSSASGDPSAAGWA